jgi:hypothetical protein
VTHRLRHPSERTAADLLERETGFEPALLGHDALFPGTFAPSGAPKPSESAPSGVLTEPTASIADPVEAALADAVRKATDADAWDVVKAIVGELEARRKARAGVVDLDAVRRERGAR